MSMQSLSLESECISIAYLSLYSLQLFVASTRLQYSYVCQPIRHITRPDELQVRKILSYQMKKMKK